MLPHFELELFFDEIEIESLFTVKQKIGKGKSKNGKRKSWKKSFYFEQNLLAVKHSTNKFAGMSHIQINAFFDQIKHNLIRPNETEIHAKNKLLLWLDRLHNSVSWRKIADEYDISESSAINFVNDLLNSILISFQGTGIISFPTKVEKYAMVNILKKKNVSMPQAIFTFDGKDAICCGKSHSERLSYKYRFLPCFSVLFLVERALGTVCAFNLDPEGKKHDITVLRESSWYGQMDEIMDGWLALGDTGYKNEPGIAAAVRKNDFRRRMFSKTFWKEFNTARSDSERVFAHFFSNKFPLLNNWKGKKDNTFDDWALNVTCCIILYNYLKKNTFIE